MKNKLHGILTLLLAFVVQLTFAQEKTITGTVVDDQGLPLPGVNITIEGSSTGTQTDFDGEYSLSAEEGQVLIFSFVGFATQEITVGASNQLNVTLRTDTAALEEVVVVGFGTQEQDKVIQTVSVVDEDQLDDIPAQSPQDLLQGQASGVTVTNASGVLGARSNIRVRGVNSLTSGAQPLFVVDGVPLDDSDQTFSQGSDGGLNPLASINPESIETMTVLKDAAATSIYGSRGSNGVILITTKRGGKNNKPVITAESFVQISEATDVPNVLNTQQYGQFYADVLRIGDGLDINNPEELLEAGGGDYTGPGFDWMGAATRTGYTHTQNVSLRGGGERVSYYLGLNRTDAEGFIVGNNLETTGIRLNLSADVTDNIRAGANMSTTFLDNDRIGEENNIFAPYTAAQLIRPNAQPRDENGNFIPSGQTGQNFLGIEALNTNNVGTTRMIGNVFTEVDFLDQFTYRISVGLDKRYEENQFRDSEVFTPGGEADQSMAVVEKFVVNNTLDWSNSFGDHNFGVLLGQSYESTDISFLRAAATDFISDDLPNVGSGSNPTTTSYTTSGSRLLGYFTRFNYDFASRYLFEASLRRDGSSRFGQDNRFGDFWALSTGWNIHSENFMQDQDFFNRLGLRASIGTTGNDRIGDFTSQATFGSGDYLGNPGLVNTGAPLPDLQWEETRSFDIGVRSAMLDNKVRFNVSYYQKRTENALLDVPVASYSGQTSLTRNAGVLENSGWEFDLGVTAISTEEFTWDFNINLSTLSNEVIDLPGASEDIEGRQFVSGTAAQRAVVGESTNNFYLIRYVGVNPETGDAEFLDADGEITTSPNANDRKIVGSPLPDFFGGITTKIAWKNFDLTALFNYSYGNDILIDGYSFSQNGNFIGSFNLDTKVLDYWTPENTNAYIPSPASSTFGTYANYDSDFLLRDGSFLRLKNLTLGYNLPQDLMGSIGFLTGARLYVTGTNLLTIKGENMEGVDPEVTDSLDPLRQGQSFFVAPQSKSVLFGVKLNF